MRLSKAAFGLVILTSVSIAADGRAAILSGRVTDGVNGVFDVNLNVFDSASQTQIPTSADHTDANGFFAFTVPTGTFDIHVIPPITDRLVGVNQRSVVISGDTNLGTIVTQPGFILSGTVQDSGALPVDAVDIDVIDPVDGTTIYTPGDNTDATGFVDVVVPAGTWDVAIDPPTSLFLVARVLPGIAVSGDTSFGTVTVQNGFALSGNVAGPGNAPVVGADIDVRDSFSGASVRLNNDNTDSLGNFSVIVPPGSLDVAVQPVVASRLVPTRMLKVDVSGNVNVGTINVVSGLNVSGIVRVGGTPRALVDIDAYDASDDSVPIQGDRTDANGAYSTIVPAGTDDLVVDLPSSTGFKHILLENRSITSDLMQDFTLQASPITADIVPSEIGVTRGSFLHYTIAIRKGVAIAGGVDTMVVASALGGAVTRTLSPRTRRSLPAGQGTSTFGPFQTHIPPTLAARFSRLPVRVTVFVMHPTTGAVIDKDFFTFRVY
ncbi:MAG: hypothetical protein HYR85_17690 [Planctomycetes bacterium]|nr:hypothetical protein [Planctomycetota bacterium]MBI3845204.1 hypothetical protein [Planctomycetota bacterium]